MAEKKYINGSDLLISIDGKASGHSTTHTTTFSTETKDRAVKPASTETSGTSLWKEKSVTGLSVQVKCEGLRFYAESETGMKALLAKWKAGATVELKGFHRGGDENPYLTGNFIVTSLEESAPANEDATYSATFDNSGPVTIDETQADGVAS